MKEHEATTHHIAIVCHISGCYALDSVPQTSSGHSPEGALSFSCAGDFSLEVSGVNGQHGSTYEGRRLKTLCPGLKRETVVELHRLNLGTLPWRTLGVLPPCAQGELAAKPFLTSAPIAKAAPAVSKDWAMRVVPGSPVAKNGKEQFEQVTNHKN